MQTVMNLILRKVGDLTPGELVRINLGTGSALAILLSPNMDGDPVYGVVSSPDFVTPLTWYEGSSTDRCLSYGTEWLLEERPGSETAPGLSIPGGGHGAASYDSTGLFLRFSAPQGFAHQAFHFNLSTSQLARQAGIVAPLARWAIWANREQLLNPRAGPLFEYPPAAATE